jgi:hypothetical protein
VFDPTESQFYGTGMLPQVANISASSPPRLDKSRGSGGACVRDPEFTTYAVARWAEDFEMLDTTVSSSNANRA